MFFMPGMPGMPGMGGMGFPGEGKGGGKGFPFMFPAGMEFEMDDDDDDEEGDGSKREAKEVDNSRLYELLELSKDCEEADIKKAYRKKAMVHHPDRGGDEAKFKEISEAHEILSDPERRKAYDKYGEDSLKEDGPGSGGGNIFETIFGGGPQGGKKQKPRTKDVVRPMWLTLEDMYTGVTKLLPLARKVIDEGAEPETCPKCKGKGYITQIIRMGPMVQQLQQPCDNCNGTGKVVPQKTERTVEEVFVEKGAPDGHKITLHGKADEKMGCEPGDVVVIVKEQDHPRFLRKGADLYLEQDISLGEALAGFRLCVPHLDGKKLIVSSKPGEVLQPKQGGMALKAIPGAGMPFHQDPFTHGNLFLVLAIRFPRYIDPVAANDLRALLGAPKVDEPLPDTDGTEEEVMVEDIDPFESAKKSKKVVTQAYDEDEMQGGIACKQQ